MISDPAEYIPLFVQHLLDTGKIDKKRTYLASTAFRPLWFDWACIYSVPAPHSYLSQFMSAGMARFTSNRTLMYDFARVRPLCLQSAAVEKTVFDPVSRFQLFVSHLIDRQKLDQHTTMLDYDEISRCWFKWVKAVFGDYNKNFRAYFLSFNLRRVKRKYKILFDFSTVEPLRTLIKIHDPAFKMCVGCKTPIPKDETFTHLVRDHHTGQINLLADTQRSRQASVGRIRALEQALSEEIQRRDHLDRVLADLSKQYEVLIASYGL